MKLTPAALTFALLATSTAAFATAAPTHNFDLFLNNKKAATATYTIEKTKAGLKVHSTIDSTLDKTHNVLSNTYRIGTDGIIDGATVQNPIDHTTTYYTPSKANDSLSISSIRANVPSGAFNVPLNPQDLVIAFANDPSVWQVLLEVTTAHPHADSVYSVFIPASATSGARIEPYHLSAPAEATGTLDGKPITLKHYTLTFNAGTAHLYADADGNLMQAQIDVFNLTHTRVNFALDAK